MKKQTAITPKSLKRTLLRCCLIIPYLTLTTLLSICMWVYDIEYEDNEGIEVREKELF